MVLRKFRSAEEMPGPAPLRPLEADNLRVAFGLMDLADHLCPVRYSPGVRRFRSWDEALIYRARRAGEQARELRASRGASGPR